MLDVHPPEHAAHSWSDFFIHIATIAVGLLIAVGIEQTVELIHHHHQVHIAREHIREEGLVNQRILREDQREVEQMETNMDRALMLVRNHQIHAPATSETPDFTYRLQGFYDAAYDNARTSGVLSLMPYEESAMYEDAYTANAMCQKYGLELWTQIYFAKAAMHGRPIGQIDTEELLPLISAISEVRGKAELVAACFKVQDQEWDSLLSGHFRNDIGAK